MIYIPNMIGFIGAGNMGGALIKSLLFEKSEKSHRHSVMVFDPHPAAKKHLPRSGISWCRSPEEVLEKSSIVFLCIKPKDVTGFFNTQRKHFTQQIVISIIAGLTIQSLRKTANLPRLKVCRIMPNLAAAIGKGTGTVTYSKNISKVEKKKLQSILSASGLYIEIQESLVDAVTAISGCGPAFVFLFIEALTQAAMKLKVPRKQALSFAVATVIGAGSLLQASEHEPLKLTEQVSSPGGMTLEGVNWLNQSDFQEIVTEAVFRAHAKAKILFKN